MVGPVRSERGSLPVVMLAVMIVGTLGTVLVGSVVVGQRQTGFDQGFEQSLQVAETGLERMSYLIESGQRTDDFSIPEAAVPGGRYEGAADRNGRSWALTATGTAVDGTSRTITLTLGRVSPFQGGAFGRSSVDLRGANSADSYRSGTFNAQRQFSVLAGGSNTCGDVMCSPTGKGSVATNGDLFLHGQVIDNVDQARIHYAREEVDSPLTGATGLCSGVSHTCTSDKLAYFREPLVLEPDPVVPPEDLLNRGSFTGGILPAGRQLYTNLTLDSSTIVQGTPENPTIVYLTGTLTVRNDASVNFQQIAGVPVPKPSPGLLIFSAGVGPALRFGNHANFSGAVYAPRATFSGGAQGNIYGSIVTGSISTNGGWSFHYDEALGDVEAEARFVASGWTER